MEKRKPHYSLASIKSTFATVETLRMTITARNTVFKLGIDMMGVVVIIQRMTEQQFYKSMTSLADSRVWQDVYHVRHELKMLYVKFTTDAQGYIVISCKEK